MTHFFEVWVYTHAICHGRFTFETLLSALRYCEDKESRGYRCELNRMPL